MNRSAIRSPCNTTGGRMTGYIYLAIAITAEVIATTSMKALDGFSRPLPLLLVVAGYSLSFWMLSLVVKTIPVGIAYAIWAGLGIVLVSVAAALIYQQKLDLPAAFGMALIVAGVLVIQLFSRSAGH
jgi:small multidrug resistance pump